MTYYKNSYFTRVNELSLCLKKGFKRNGGDPSKDTIFNNILNDMKET